METPESTCPTSSARDQPASVSGPPGAPSGQASPRLSLGPVILPPEQSLPPTVFLKALPIPLYHTVPPGGLQPRAPLVTGSLDGGNVPFILSPLLQPEGTGPIQVGKPTAPALTVNIVGTLPVLSSGLGPTLGSPGKVRNAGKYLCPHCGRDCLKPSVLEKHIRSHTGERPFPCATCGIAFKTQSNLYKHRRTQTHLNNSRLSLESEGGGNNLLEEGDRAGDPSAADGRGDLQNQSTGKGPPGRPASLGGHLSKSLDVRTEAAPCQGSTLAHREGPLDSSQMVLPGLPLASTQPRRKLPEAKPCSLPRQQEASSEKPWDTKTSEGRLRKCESTDSGYLSRSDSVEQPLLPPSPLRSLSEHSAESEAEGGPGPGTGGTRAEPAVPGASLELEKKRLEERIAQLISHNQAVVDDPQLDHVRPRKTILSKQGSIDLPMPYTYKDSFHFDIRALEPGRRKTALSPARSTFTTLDKSRPLFFHSVPTQLSTTVECVPVTRSNSLPFVEGSRTWPEPRDLQDTCPRAQKPLSPRPTSGGLGCRSGLTLAEVSSGPTRALVRQAAVEDLPGTPAADALAPTEGLAGKRVSAGEGVVCKGRAASKKSSQRRLKMFSQEKWQVYGNETFKRIYQKMKASHQGSQKAREGRAGRREELDLPPQEEGGESRGTALSQDSRVPILRDTSIEAESGSWGIVPAQEGSVETEICTQRRTVTRAGSRDQPTIDKAVSTPTPTTRDPPCLGNRSLLLSPNGRLDLKWQLVPAPGTLQGHDPGDSRLVLSDPTLESGNADGSEVKETCLWTQTVLREPDGGSVEPSPPEDKLPSERKKLKVEGLGAQEQLEPRGEEAPGSPGKAASLPSQRQDSDPKEVSADIQESAQKAAECSLSSDTSSVAPAAALKGEGPGDQEPTLPLAVGTPGQRSQPASKPRAPSLLVTVPNNTFPPKYLLKMPQEDTPYPLPTSTRPMQDPHPLCARRPFENQATILNSKWGMPWSPGPASGLPAAEVDSIQKDPGCSRPKEARNEAQVGGEMGPETDTAPPATEQCPSSAAAAPWETASFPPVSTCDTPMAQDKGGETHTICCCTGSMSGRARSSGHVLSSWASNREPRSLPSPEEEPEDPSLQTPAELNPSCPSQPGSSLTRAQHMALGWPELPLSHDLGTLRSCGAQSPFPSLKAEPRLTWCCLSRSLPLPEEQKEKTASVYLALHVPGGHLHDGGPGTLSMSTGGWLSHLIVPGMRPQDQTSDSERKKGLSCRRVKMAHGNNKQKKMRINPKRSEGNFWQSRAQLRASRLRRSPWGPRRSCLPPSLEGQKPCRPLKQPSSEVAGLKLQESFCVTSRSSLDCGNEENVEENCGQISETTLPGISSRAITETDKLRVKQDISPPAGDHGDCFPHEDSDALSGLCLQSDTCLAMAKDDLLPPGKDPDGELLETQLPSSQEQVSVDPKSSIFSDAQASSPLEPKATFPCQDIATSAAALSVSLGLKASHTMLPIHSAEPQDHPWAMGGDLAQSSPDRRAIAEGMSQTLLPGKPAAGQIILGSAPLGSAGKIHPETPASGPSSSSSQQEEGRENTVFPVKSQYECGEMGCPPLGNESGKCQVSGLISLKGCAGPSNPAQPSEVPGAPSKSIRKRSLEGMRKQTRVELSDTSSDDEDRLVIEI